MVWKAHQFIDFFKHGSFFGTIGNENRFLLIIFNSNRCQCDFTRWVIKMVLSTTGNVFIRTLFLGKQGFTGPVKETQRGTLSLLKDKLLPDIVRSFSNRTEQQVTVATYAKNILKEKASGSSGKTFCHRIRLTLIRWKMAYGLNWVMLCLKGGLGRSLLKSWKQEQLNLGTHFLFRR